MGNRRMMLRMIGMGNGLRIGMSIRMGGWRRG